jgi:hypothetical protein
MTVFDVMNLRVANPRKLFQTAQRNLIAESMHPEKSTDIQIACPQVILYSATRKPFISTHCESIKQNFENKSCNLVAVYATVQQQPAAKPVSET